MTKETSRTTRRARTAARWLLVLATEAVDEAALRKVVALGLDGESPAAMLVIAPALNSRLRHWLSDEDEARRGAGVRLAASLEQLAAAGIAARGLVGDADPLQAIADALYQYGPERS